MLSISTRDFVFSAAGLAALIISLNVVIDKKYH